MADNEKPSNLEEEYFAREEIEKKRKAAREQSEAVASARKEELKKLHFMKCPKCGMDLQTVAKSVVEIDVCFTCQGVWLDKGELETLMARGLEKGGGVMKAVLNWFKKE